MRPCAIGWPGRSARLGGIATDSPNKHPATGARSAVSSSLDVMLTDAASIAARRGVSSSPARRVKVGARLARAPDRVARRSAAWGASSGAPPVGARSCSRRGATGASATAAWQENWLLRRLLQSYLAVGGGRRRADLRRRAGLAHRAPGALRRRRTCSTRWRRRTSRGRTRPCCARPSTSGGANLVQRRPALRCATCPRPPRLPASVDTEQVRGRRQPRASRPARSCCAPRSSSSSSTSRTTEQVREVPLLLVPPTINRYYILDIAPGPQHRRVPRARRASRCSLISWRNPGAGPGPLRPRHLRRGRARGARRGRRDHPAASGQRQRRVLGRHHHRRRARPPRRRPAGSARSPA